MSSSIQPTAARKCVTLRLTLLVTFETPDDADLATFRQNLLAIPSDAASHGMMSQGSEQGAVTHWKADVDTVYVSTPPNCPLVVDGTADDDTLQGDDGELSAPFYVFDPNQQCNVAGPFDTREEARAEKARLEG